MSDPTSTAGDGLELGPTVDPQALARAVAALDASRLDPLLPGGRRRAATRLLDAVRERMEPLPRPEMLVGQVLALPDDALGLAALALAVAAPGTPLGDGIAALWRRAADAARAGAGADPEGAGAAAFEAVIGRLARSAATRMDVRRAVLEPSAAEWFIRALVDATGLATAVGARAESSTRRRQALERLDPAAARATAVRLRRDERVTTTLAALDRDLASGAALPDAARYGAL